MTRFGVSELRLSDRWTVIAEQTQWLDWAWTIDADTCASLLSARDAGRILTAQQRDPATQRMVLLAKLAGA